MSFITCTFQSNILQKSVQFNVILPQNIKQARVLYLLHGLSDDYSAWSRHTCIERYANEFGFVVIMPDGGKSYYTDMSTGDMYYKHFTEEIFTYIPSVFNINCKRENTFIAGLSMGGYGALKFALRNPELFFGAASLSGCVDVCHRLKTDPRWKMAKTQVFGAESQVKESENDLFYLLKNNHFNTFPVHIYLACGTEDFLYKDNLLFAEELKKYRLSHQISFSTGIHDWIYWDNEIQEVLKYMRSL